MFQGCFARTEAKNSTGQTCLQRLRVFPTRPISMKKSVGLKVQTKYPSRRCLTLAPGNVFTGRTTTVAAPKLPRESLYFISNYSSITTAPVTKDISLNDKWLNDFLF